MPEALSTDRRKMRLEMQQLLMRSWGFLMWLTRILACGRLRSSLMTGTLLKAADLLLRGVKGLGGNGEAGARAVPMKLFFCPQLCDTSS